MKRFIPRMYQESIYTIPYNNLKKKGVKCLLFDLDNNRLIIKKHDQVCALCYNKCEEDSIEVNGNLICSKCVDEIRKGA